MQRKWPLGQAPSISDPIPEMMDALTIHRDHYGQPADVIHFEEVEVPRLKPEDAGSLLVAVLASGPNFNTNFAAMGLPVEPFGRGDSATIHIPGSDALGIVVDAGPAVENFRIGQAVILDSWTPERLVRGYETHDGFNAQFAVVDQVRAQAIPRNLSNLPAEQLAATLLTYGTAYRAVVEKLRIGPGDSILLMGGGKGTSFAGAQIAKSLGARVILMGSNQELGDALIARGVADAFINRKELPQDVYGVLTPDESCDDWMKRTEPFREAVFKANKGKPVDKIFEHTGGANFPLLVSALADKGALAFFGATGSGLKGEYKETFFYDKRRYILDARWVWMRQKHVLFRNQPAREIFREINLLPGKRGLIWGADEYAREFVIAALERKADLLVIASKSNEQQGIKKLLELGIKPANIIDRDRFDLVADMPDPLTDEGTLNPVYNSTYMAVARSIGRAIWAVFGPRTSPDFIVERTDQSTLHYSTFLLRDFSEEEEMTYGVVVAKGKYDLAILGSHMYRATQATEVVRLLENQTLEMEKEDLEVVSLAELPKIQQQMLNGTMKKPKGVSLVQAATEGVSIVAYVKGFLGETLLSADQKSEKYINACLSKEGIATISLERTEALNALNDTLLAQISTIFTEIKNQGTLHGKPVKAVILCGSGRAFVAGADVNEFLNKSSQQIAEIAACNLKIFSTIENLEIPVIALVDGFALGGGNELSMSAHYRIVTENATLGQPEVKLGIIPGYGGSQRLPRLIGPQKALEMSINGEAVSGRQAVELGLADEFHHSGTALTRAFRIAQDIVSGGRTLPRKDWDQLAAGQKEELEEALNSPQILELCGLPVPTQETAKDLRIARSYAARFIIEAMRYGYDHGFAEGLKNDAKLFGEVAASLSGQEWVQRFVDKDPAQGAFLTILKPKRQD